MAFSETTIVATGSRFHPKGKLDFGFLFLLLLFFARLLCTAHHEKVFFLHNFWFQSSELARDFSHFSWGQEWVFCPLLGGQVFFVGYGLVLDRFRFWLRYVLFLTLLTLFLCHFFRGGILAIFLNAALRLPGFVLVGTPVVSTSTVLFGFLAASCTGATIVLAFPVPNGPASSATKLGVAIIVRSFAVQNNICKNGIR
jgi:hypothetical protein